MSVQEEQLVSWVRALNLPAGAAPGNISASSSDMPDRLVSCITPTTCSSSGLTDGRCTGLDGLISHGSVFAALGGCVGGSADEKPVRRSSIT